jgi:hypothetical protein
VAVSTVVAVSTEAGSTREASAVVVSVGDVSAVAVSAAEVFVAAVSITGSLMMSSSADSAFRAGGARVIRTDITVTTITRMDTVDIHMVTMDTVVTRTAMDTAGTVTTVAPVMDIAMEAERVMDMAMAAEPVTGTAMAADQGIPGVRGAGDMPGYGFLKSPACLARVHSKNKGLTEVDQKFRLTENKRKVSIWQAPPSAE